MEKILEEILHSPKMNIYFQELQNIFISEQKKRNQFYDEVSDFQKAEFINGEIIIHSPVKLKHDNVSGTLFVALRTYVKEKKSGYVGHEKLMISLSRNDYEPDICFFKTEKSKYFVPDQMKFPVPDLIVEVLSESTESRDRTIKFEDYAIHGVMEYWIVDPENKMVEQYLLKNNIYELILKASDGKIKSFIVEDFIMEIPKIFEEF